MVRSLLVFAFLPRTFVFCALDACFVLRQTFTIYPANVERGETLFFSSQEHRPLATSNQPRVRTGRDSISRTSGSQHHEELGMSQVEASRTHKVLLGCGTPHFSLSLLVLLAPFLLLHLLCLLNL